MPMEWSAFPLRMCLEMQELFHCRMCGSSCRGTQALIRPFSCLASRSSEKNNAEKERLRALQRQRTGWWLRLQIAAGRSPCEMREMLPRYSRQETSPVFSEAGFQANNGALEIETVIYLPLLSLSESRGIPYCLALSGGRVLKFTWYCWGRHG